MEKSVFITDPMIARLRRNVAQEPWAKQAAQHLVERAAPWLAQSDEELWNLMFGPTIRRSWKVNANGVCPACQAPVPMYTWRIDAEKAPWKVTCPHCAERFPKNDFAAFYKSGLDKHGVFAPELADRSLLFNVEHPDPKDPLHQFGVDDGTSYQAGESRWYFIGTYLIYGPWKQQIIPGIEVLAAAYMVTDDSRYAHKAAILLDRVADLYPGFDYGTQSTQVPTGAGYVSTWHDACRETAAMVEAYDVIRGALPELTGLTAFLSAQARRYQLDNPKAHWTDIQRNIEDRILRDAMHNSHKVASNYPRGEINQNIIRAVLGEPDGPIAAQARLDAIIERATRVDGITGEKGLAAYSAYTIWTLASYLAQLSRRDPAFLPALLKRHPILRQTYRFHIDTWCLQRYYPNEGDGTDFADIVTLWNPERKPGYAGMAFPREPGVEASTFTLLMELYRATGDTAYAQVAYHANNRSTENLPYDLFAENPAALRKEIEKVIAAEGPVIKLKSVNKEQWCLAILRSGAGDRERALWLDYDIGGGAHAHADGLNLGLFAYGLDLLPDCGYPQIQYSGAEAIKAGWFQRTASHNTVVVDGRNRGQTLARGKTTLWADGTVLRGIRAGFDGEPYPLTWAYGRHYGHVALYSYFGGRFGKVRVWTRPNSSEPWQLQFSDDFQRTELGPDWEVMSGAWQIENGQVVGKGTLRCKRFLPGQHRLEYEAIADGAEVCDLSAYLGWDGESTGCFFGFGSQRNAGSKILVRDIVAATSDTRIVPGQLHRVTCLCEDRLQLIVDGAVCAQCDHLPNRSFEFIFGDATGKKQFERTVASIDVSPENFYVVDIFRVQGGTDHARLFHSYFGTVTTSGLALAPGEEYGHGTLLRNFRTDSAAKPGWQVDWTIEDRLKLLPAGTKVRLRHTDLTTAAEATVAESWVNVGNFNAKDEVWIPTLITRRRGTAPLASTFVEIIEPYEDTPRIKSTRRLPLQTADGKVCPDNCVAIEVELADGRRDLILSISRTDGMVTQPDWNVRTDGELCFIRRDAAGRTIHTMLCKGRILEAGELSITNETTVDCSERSASK